MNLTIEATIKDPFEQMKGLEEDLRRLTKRNLKLFSKEKKKYA
jgi:hypothetical protein